MKKRYMILGLLVLLFVLYTALFNRSIGAIPDATLRPFDKGGFVDSEALSDTNKLVAENTDFALYLDETTSYFYVLDKATSERWYSNPDSLDPWDSDPNQSITKSALDKQRSTLELSYFNDKGAVATINNYEYSIYHPESILNDEGMRTYSIKYIDDGFQVLYVIEDLEIDYLYFPKFLKPEVLESLDNRDVLEAIAYTGYDEERDLYEIVQYQEMSILVKKRLYDTFYGEDGLGYSREQAIQENADYGYTETFEKVRFEIGIEVHLTDRGVETSILHDSIVEPNNVKLASVSLYPLFGTALANPTGLQDGYIVLPDGSGAVMNFNNGKSYQEPYVKRLYGQDLAVLPYKMAEVQEKISLPLYGMIKDNVGGFAAIITAGDAMATLRADVSGRIDSYNKVYPTFWFREVESVTLGSGFNQYGIDLWTEERVETDFTVEYEFLAPGASYVDIAMVYRNHLIEVGLLEQDTTTSTVVTTEFLGAFDKKNFILGVPYYSTKAMTTFDQAMLILDDMRERGLTTMNVQYTGMMNGGLSTEMNDRFDLERTVGSRREYREFVSYLEDEGMDFYPTLQLMTTSDFTKMFDQYRYSSSRIDGSSSILFDYHLPSKLPYSETAFGTTKEDYVINPRYITSMYADFADDYNGTGIAFEWLGSGLASDYNEDDLTYKQDALRIQNALLDGVEETVLLQNPLGFAIPSASYITDLPIETTLYAILDYQIPLVQMILSGYVDYATASLNLNNARSIEYNFLKVLETGSNVKYTLSYEDSKLLRETEYNYYLSTQYTNWLDHIEDTVKQIDDIGIHQGHLVGHEMIQNNVVQVTYSHGLTILLNYNLSPVTIGTVTIGAMDYHIVGGA